MIGRYVEARDSDTWERGIIRGESTDGRILYVELEGESDLFRFSPDEVRPCTSPASSGTRQRGPAPSPRSP